MIKTIATIIGARPQFIKSSPFSKIVGSCKDINELIINTGQHFDANMSRVFFDEMELSTPSYNLNINKYSRGKMIDKMVIEIEQILIKENVSAVLVYGDTNSTLAGAIAGSRFNVPIFHIESGLRSWNRFMHEEINRIITDHLSSLLFCPTVSAINNLKEEKIIDGVVLSGDVMFDCYLNFKKIIPLQDKKLLTDRYILATIHRRENLDSKERLSTIISNLDSINNHTKILMPIHPHTRKVLNEFNLKSKIDFIEPMGYLSLLKSLNNCELVITDSGGLQKEAYFAKKKCLTVRTETEWTELTKSGVSILTEPESILKNLELLRGKKCDFSTNFYGDGMSSSIIFDSIKSYLL